MAGWCLPLIHVSLVYLSLLHYRSTTGVSIIVGAPSVLTLPNQFYLYRREEWAANDSCCPFDVVDHCPFLAIMVQMATAKNGDFKKSSERRSRCVLLRHLSSRNDEIEAVGSGPT